jgi:serine phosphatase RsbU (regulator of sigma subunit)
VQVFQKEQEKNQLLQQKQAEMQNELNYYKNLAGMLANKVREREEGYYTIMKTEFNPRPDIC